MKNNKYKDMYVKYDGAKGKDSAIFFALEEENKLTEGVFYKVEYINMGRYSTRVKLQNFDKYLSSIPFSFYTIKENKIREINIKADPRYNPYLIVDMEK